ncbi:hypothetical protein KP509_38G044300 [Ceratopteris richardii]|uniref:Cilia- and flagella-associated protein 157 n=1 Tax=Ceratopteris richardii TaxID=49495 RepID=A0A8T2Q4H2_CERRI|nr:hypothetical protein KP509_38G044300 [Ceratopteris richardii]KAH7278491.1 hypothetical protein KP509_38G044300 [Ceratopteris richardii]KAH7278492.1 hypothetical protein KP509_38G044300 [Ceratopteris richardii]KAH7278493.1 hypothetical protein KP509_38G044300 [Ceratopteris richardii]KAH7278495.1 hypothetical protein KP509_38G044300 [Ceratopteris richardii]
MPPKKGGSGRKDGSGRDDKAGNIEGLLLEKDLEIATLLDKLSRLEKRSLKLTVLTEKQHNAAKEMEEKLQDVISCLTIDVKEKEEKINGLEVALGDLKAESTATIEALTKDLNELRNTHKFVTEDLRLQLANAQVQLRDIDDFRAKKTAIEQEVVGLKEKIEEERKKHQDVISDIERAALQEKERLRKEMTVRIEETKIQMLQQMDEQLHAKTKRTMVENEQLGKELGYHVRQTEMLLEKNEKLVQENIELHRKVLLAKEVQEDLSHRNRMNQKTIRILLYKLRERHYRLKSEKHAQEQELKVLSYQHNSEPFDILELNQKSRPTDDKSDDITTRTAEEALKFLQACLESIETDHIDKIIKLRLNSRLKAEVGDRLKANSCHENPFDGLNSQEKHEVLMHILRAAVSLRAVCQNAGISSQWNESPHLDNISCKEEAFSVDEILKLPIERLCLGDAVVNKSERNVKSVSSSAQTDEMDVEEHIILEMKHHLQACNASGAGA